MRSRFERKSSLVVDILLENIAIRTTSLCRHLNEYSNCKNGVPLIYKLFMVHLQFRGHPYSDMVFYSALPMPPPQGGDP